MSKVVVVYGYYDENDHYGTLLTAINKQLHASDISENDISVVNTFAFTQKHLSNNLQPLSAPPADWFRGHRTEENKALIQSEQDKIVNASHIILIYPIWFESCPQYMFSWLSEVFRSASFNVGQGGEILPRWTGDRKVMIITTAGFNQQVRLDSFEQLLAKEGLEELLTLPSQTKIKLMEMAQTYPIKMALQYSGLNYTTQLHISEVDKGSNPRVVAAVENGVKEFIAPTVTEALLDAPKPVIFSGRLSPVRNADPQVVPAAVLQRQQTADIKERPALH